MKKIFVLSAMLMVTTSSFAEDQFSLGTGFDYSSGKYGSSTTTDILYIPVVAKYETGDLTLKLTVPYLRMTGTSSGVVRGMGRVGPGMGPAKMKTTTTTTSNSTSGLGDIVAAAGYTVYDQDALSLDVVGKVKFGTASSSNGLGTGKNDYSAQLDGYYVIDETTAFATAGYKIVGDPAGLALNNVAFGTLGASQNINDKISAGVMLDVEQSASPTGSGPVEVTFFASKKLSKQLKAQVSLLKGFSDGSADVGVGAMITGMFY
jgi:hypothetical protein